MAGIIDTMGSRSCGCQLLLHDDDTNGELESGSVSNAWAKAMGFIQLSAVTFSLLAAVKLKVFDVLAKHHPRQQLSASQILSHITSSPKATAVAPPSSSSSSSLDRLLRLLSSHSLLTSSVSLDVDSAPTTLYGLTPASEYFIQDHEHASLAPLFLIFQHQAIVQSGQQVSEAILGGVSSFFQAHAHDLFTYLPGDPEFHQLFNSAMINHSELLMRSLLRVYHGFDGLTSIVDVGGGFGACVNAIVQNYPHIKGINFDEPHVIQAAPPTYQAGVQHVPGDMFDTIPQADAIFLKWILHDWSDEDCIKILGNCYFALPIDGKVIVVDVILPNTPDNHVNSRLGYGWDQLMFLFTRGGHERTETELRELAQLAGFSKVQVICKLNEFSVMEMYKT